jgi:hypothetical protein
MLMRPEWLVVVGGGCLVIALIEAWCLVAVRSLQVSAAKALFKDSGQLLRSHIDYLMMTSLLLAIYCACRTLAVTPPGWMVAAMCLGSVMNPAAFLAAAIHPPFGKEATGLFAGIVTVSFVLTTSGYGGAAWLLARAALAAG